MKTYLFFIVFLVITSSYAQLPHTFTQTAHNTHYGVAYGIGVASDGTIFLANGSNGLCAYTYNGTSFNNTAHINDDQGFTYAYGVAVDSDGAVFLANYGDGLRTYSYNDTSFANIAHINDGNFPYDVTVGPDGTIITTNFREGIFAYTYSDYVAINDYSNFCSTEYTLAQNYPNPFNPTTTVSYSIPKPAFVKLIIYDVLGRKVKTLVNQQQKADSYSMNFIAGEFSSGIYFYTLQVGGHSNKKGQSYTETKKMLLIR